MKVKKFTALLLAALLVLSLTACGTKDNEKKADMSSNDSAMTDEPKNAEEALALHKKLLEQENTLLSQNTALWEKVFMAADKGMTLQEDGKNYGEFLLDTIEGAKDQFTDEEYEMLKESATEISNIESKLTELDALNKELAEKGGALIGVNTFTLDGDEAAISEAKDVLAKKGATYPNVYFASDGEAGKFTTNIFAYPTTYVVDRNGNIVGDPIVGAITEKKQTETLQKLIDQALAADMG